MKKRLILCIVFIMASIFVLSCSQKSEKPENAFSIKNVKNVNQGISSKYTFAKGFSEDIAVLPLDAPNSEGSENLKSEAALLVDLTEGKILFNKNAHMREYPASITKIFTAYLAIRNGNFEDRCMGDEVVFPNDSMLCDFRPGDVIPFDIVLHGALIQSGNNAATALACYVKDSVPEFVAYMNEEARKLGATQTNFVNCNGLSDPNHYTTAYDMYLMFKEAVKYPYFVQTIGCAKYTNTFKRTTAINTYVIKAQYENPNEYLRGVRQPKEGIKILGGKSGHATSAKFTYVMLSEYNGHKYASITMKANNYTEVFDDMDYLSDVIINSNK